MTESDQKTDAENLMDWLRDVRTDHDKWTAAHPPGTRDNPIVVEASRCICLVTTDAGDWGTLDHGHWTETPGRGVGAFTVGYLPADWYASEREARAVYLLDSGQIDRAALVQLVVNNLDTIPLRAKTDDDDD